MAWVRIAVYQFGEGDKGRDEVVRLVREGAVPLLRGLPGFIDYELVETGDTLLATSHWQTREEAEGGHRANDAWRQESGPGLPRLVAVSIGEVIIPREGQ